MARPNLGRSIDQEANLAERIRHERELRAWSYETLAKAMTDEGCRVQGSAIFKIEKVEPRRRITVDELVALSRVFDLDVEELLVPVEVMRQEAAKDLAEELRTLRRDIEQKGTEFYDAMRYFYTFEHLDPEVQEFVWHQVFGPNEPGER